MQSNLLIVPILCAMLAAPVRGEVIESTAAAFPYGTPP